MKGDAHPRDARSKIVRWSELAKIVSEAQSAGRKVVFTNGCFDLIHVGHVRYLHEARLLGDVLVVGVNSDDSVKRLKGANRPFVPEFDRLEVLAALESVDYVTLFSEDTPIKLIERIKPDIHVKGGDYEADDLPEAKTVKCYGGTVVVISLDSIATRGKSTTDLAETIREQGTGNRVQTADGSPLATDD